MNNRLIVPTLKGFTDCFRTAITSDNSCMFLFNPASSEDLYELIDNVFYYQSHELSPDEIQELASNPKENKPIKENLLVYGVFSYLYSLHDLRNHNEFETTISSISYFLGLSTGTKGFKLKENMEELGKVYGVIVDKCYPLLEVEERNGNLIIRSEYMHHALNLMLQECNDRYGERGRYYTDSVHANLVNGKNKIAALVVIELASLIARAKGNQAHISLKSLAYRVPPLLNIWLSDSSISMKNRKLRRVFENLYDLLGNKTELYIDLKDLEISIPQLSVSKPDAVIRIRYKGYNK
ncbi:hypothetical protein [Schinkia azotoformans]|uniref:hypothetical protein n=1 Tax=Schinkia azotoformans TaxID=1454 RepID=UPI002DBE25F0|nr:hypothetical protein [Schinkia azotoformans]MEC1717799.1 hypothetical protein [Schinkia azotoformans]MEC1743569.1 hypothetical protein [Schinkia azotoformans]MEC1746557.1 hypothetical protein [Schinkia azotoformans]MEC1757799.1 hypothetical protein [Schinkia azotoformans]MEC1769306.1 hypothetical protein [Schinkia azotoformans]